MSENHALAGRLRGEQPAGFVRLVRQPATAALILASDRLFGFQRIDFAV